MSKVTWCALFKNEFSIRGMARIQGQGRRDRSGIATAPFLPLWIALRQRILPTRSVSIGAPRLPFGFLFFCFLKGGQSCARCGGGLCGNPTTKSVASSKRTRVALNRRLVYICMYIGRGLDVDAKVYLYLPRLCGGVFGWSPCSNRNVFQVMAVSARLPMLVPHRLSTASTHFFADHE